MSKVKSTENWLLPVPSSYSPRVPGRYITVGSDTYEIGGQNTCSSSTYVRVYNNRVGKRHKAPSMTLSRKNPLMCSFGGKLYVMGGCEADESTYWAEVFDTRTQTWEPLPDPGADLRFSPVKKIQIGRGKVYVRGKKKNFVYLEKESRWEVCDENLSESACEIDKVVYSYHDNKCWCRYDKECEGWRLVKGLSELNQYGKIDTEIGNYGGKLCIFWVGPARFPLGSTSEIWCAVILLEKRHHGEVWGQIEWTDHVLTVPEEYSLLPFISSLH